MHKEKNKIYNNGFSLLELSIVLSIIGLIAGGVTVGANIIHAAQLRAVITDINSYTSAMLAFKDKFDGLPGDLTNATEFWGKLMLILQHVMSRHQLALRHVMAMVMVD